MSDLNYDESSSKGADLWILVIGVLLIKPEKSNSLGFADELIYNPNVTVNALLYQGKYIEVWFKEFLTDKFLVSPL